MASYLTDSGLSAPRAADYVTEIRAAIEAELEVAIDWDSSVVMSSLVNAVANAAGDLSDTVQDLYDQGNVEAASGVHLDHLCSLVGVYRRDASASSVTLTLGASKAMTVFEGDIVQGGGTEGKAQWRISEDVNFTAAGTQTVVATCTEDGPITADAADITTIVTPRDGWDSVNNLAAATPGEDQETDSALRARRLESLQAAGATSVGSIRAALLALDGIQAAIVVENPTSLPALVEGVALDPYSVAVILYPSTLTDDQKEAAAKVLYERSTAGITQMGSQSATVTDAAGITQTVRWEWATAKTIAVTATVVLATGYALADVTDDVTAAIESVFDGLAPGDDWRVLATQGAISTVDGVVGVTLSPSTDQTVLAAEVAVAGTITVTE